MTPETLAEKLELTIDTHAINTKAGKFVRPFTKDGKPARFWEICCFVYDRKAASVTDINRRFYGSMKSDWHSVILYLCRCGLLSKYNGMVRPGIHFEKYRTVLVNAMNQ